MDKQTSRRQPKTPKSQVSCKNYFRWRFSAWLLTGLGIGAVFATVAVTLYSPESEAHGYSPYCDSETCHAAADAAEEAAALAQKASEAAESLQGELDSLSAQIAELEAEIAVNKAMINDLKVRIFETQEKLNEQRAALAQLLIAEYHNHEITTESAIDILATANSISDLADEATRQTSAEKQINQAARAVNATKLDLEQQEASIEATLADNEAKNEEIAEIYNTQYELQVAYQNDADGYSAYAKEQQAIADQEIAKKQAEELAKQAQKYGSSFGNLSTGASGWWGTNTYPYAGICPSANLAFSAYGGYICQCTSYAGWKAREKYGVVISSWGNANSWDDNARRLGYTVSSTPAAGTVGQTDAGTYGHVFWVESVNADGTINITEYNNGASPCRSGDFCARTNMNPSGYSFIYFN